jgi:hypothetical protein
MFTATGTIPLVYSAPVGIPDTTAPDGLRIEEQISLSLRSSSDDREYQFNLPITEQAPALGQLEQWQAEGKVVTVLASGLRALPFIHDTSKDQNGNPLKRYQRPGRKVTVGSNVTIEADAFIVFQAYDVRLAGSVDLDQEAQKAHGDYLKRQAEYRKRTVQARIEKARERVRAQQEAAKAAAAQPTGQAAGNASISGDAKARRSA